MDAPGRARSTLHSYISRLRRALADAHGVEIVRRSGGYALISDTTEPVVEIGKGHHAVAVDTQNALAAVQCLRSRLDEAESLHRHALTAADHSHYRQERIEALLGLATVHHHRGQLTQAVDNATAALLLLLVKTAGYDETAQAHRHTRRAEQLLSTIGLPLDLRQTSSASPESARY